MKTILLFFLIIITNCFSEINNYYNIDYLNSNYLDMCINQNNQVFICGTLATILQSNDKGLTWKKHTVISDISLIDISFLSIDCKENTLIAVGTYGKIIYSTDGGNAWKFADSITSQRLNSVVLFDSKIGIALGNSGTIIKTTNGGTNWKKINSNISDDIMTAIITKSKKILLATKWGQIYISDDIGEKWKKINNVSEFKNPYNFTFSEDNKLLLYSNNSLLISTDEGEIWTDITIKKSSYTYYYKNNNSNGFFIGDSLKILYVKDDTTEIKVYNPDTCLYPVGPSRFRRIIFFNNKDGLAVGSFNTIFRTSDGGKSWNLISFLCSYFSNFGDICFVNDSIGYLGAKFENIYKTTDSGFTWKPVPKSLERNSPSNIDDMYFFNEEKGLMISQNYFACTFLKTIDGGKNIIRDTINNFGSDNPHLLHISKDTFFIFGHRWFYNNFHFYYGFCNFQGNWWNKNSFDSTFFGGIYIKNSKNLFLYGSILDSSKLPEEPWQYYRGIIYNSTDEGINWKRTYFDTLEKVTHLYFIDEDTGYAFGNTSFGGYDDSLLVFKTTDKGINWQIIDTNMVLKTDTLKLRKKGYYFGIQQGKRVFSLNSGRNWEEYTIDNRLLINKNLTTNNSLFLLGLLAKYSPFILRFKIKDKYISAKEEKIETQITPEIWISKPYPNPAINTVNFEIAWDKKYNTDELNIKIYDILGEQLINPNIKIINKSINTGILRWYANGVIKGIYFVEIQVGSNKKTQKVLIY